MTFQDLRHGIDPEEDIIKLKKMREVMETKDRFEWEDDLNPCDYCKNNKKTDKDFPCSKCEHNANAY